MSTASHPSLRNPPDVPVLGADRFEIGERIGAGGMGTVYRAVQKSVGRQVAVKVLSSEYAANAAGVARFVREATVVSRLVHPNIVSMIEFGRDPEGNLLLVMELLEGEPLRQTLRRERKLPPWRAVQIAMQVLAALRVALAAGVVHRDLKPENIFVTNVDGADHAKVLDFGVAKMLSHEVGQETTAGSLVGTLKYMAPEQIAGDPPDARVDLYALGVLLYEMLGGGLPYEHKERVALLRAILNDPPIPLQQRAPEIPGPLAAVVMRAISKLTIDRFQTADEFRSALAQYAMVGPDARPPAFPITQEIRLPAKSTTIDPVTGARVSSPPTAISVSARRSAITSDPSGAKAIHAPPADPSIVSSVSSGAMIASDVSVAPAIHSYGTPPTYPPGAQDANYTTGAGLSAATHRSQITAPKKNTGLFVVGGLVIALAAASGGVLIAKGSGATRTSAQTTDAQGESNAQRGAAGGAASVGAHVMVRTVPAGAEVRDATSNEVLCSHTPCMVPVTGARTRRVRLALGASAIEAVLDASLADMVVPLGSLGANPTQPEQTQTPTAVTAGQDAGVRRASTPSTPRNNTRRTNGNGGNGSSGNGGGGSDIPMFGTRPGH